MKDSTVDQTHGKAHEIKGDLKEKAGRLTNNPNLEEEGKDEKVGGKMKRKSAKWKRCSRNKFLGELQGRRCRIR